MFKIKIFFFGASCLVLAGCATKQPMSELAEQSQGVDAKTLIESASLEDRLIAFVNQGRLYLVNPETGQEASVYEFSNDLPNTLSLDSFLISPDHKFIVWYVASQGIRALDLSTFEVSTIHRPTNWFNQNPFMVMDGMESVVSFIDKEGKSKFSYDLTNQTLNEVEIPYPYGTRFVVSPDGKKIIYISGFGQSESKPEYLLTSQDGLVNNFTTEGELADRDKVVFLSDSMSFVVIENGSILRKYPLENLDQPEIFADLVEEGRVIDIEALKDHIFVKFVGGDMLLLDRSNSEITHRIPAEISQGLNKVRMIPWKEDSILFEETLVQFEEQFHRLWISDMRGNKAIVIPEYHRVVQIAPSDV